MASRWHNTNSYYKQLNFNPRPVKSIPPCRFIRSLFEATFPVCLPSTFSFCAGVPFDYAVYGTVESSSVQARSTPISLWWTMSLSRILNDDPAPAAPSTSHGAHPLPGVLDPVSMISASKTPPFGEPSRNGSILSPTSSSMSIHESTLEMNHSQWQGSVIPKSGLRLEMAGEALNISSTSTATPAAGADNSQPPRKRRKPNNSEADSTQKRVRFSNVNDTTHPLTPLQQSVRKARGSALVDADESSHARGETERTLRSSKAVHTKEGSDLEECEEIWGEELNDYIRNTQRRFNKVEKWYNANAKVGSFHLCPLLHSHFL
jgi:hypothetical protein